VGDGVSAGAGGDLGQAPGDQRPRDCGAQQILALVQRIGAQHRVDELPRELIAQVLDVDLAHPRGFCFSSGGLEVLALADVGREGHDLAAVVFLQPLEDDRRIESAGVGQHHLADVVFCHVRSRSPMTGFGSI
jgi:hypothetical protein